MEFWWLFFLKLPNNSSSWKFTTISLLTQGGKMFLVILVEGWETLPVVPPVAKLVFGGDLELAETEDPDWMTSVVQTSPFPLGWVSDVVFTWNCRLDRPEKPQPHPAYPAGVLAAAVGTGATVMLGCLVAMPLSSSTTSGSLNLSKMGHNPHWTF